MDIDDSTVSLSAACASRPPRLRPTLSPPRTLDEQNQVHVHQGEGRRGRSCNFPSSPDSDGRAWSPLLRRETAVWLPRQRFTEKTLDLPANDPPIRHTPPSWTRHRRRLRTTPTRLSCSGLVDQGRAAAFPTRSGALISASEQARATVTPYDSRAATASALRGTSAAAVEADLKHPGANPIVVHSGA